MRTAEQGSVYTQLGVRRVINALGNTTTVGGSQLGPKVKAAMEEANDYFVDMKELLDKSGKAMADLLGAEAALVTSGSEP